MSVLLPAPLPGADLIKAFNVRVHIGRLVEGRSGDLLCVWRGVGGGGVGSSLRLTLRLS